MSELKTNFFQKIKGAIGRLAAILALLPALLVPGMASAADWAANYGTTGANAYTSATTVDANGNVYLGGYFNTASLTTPALTKIGTTDAFAIKLDSTGATIWQKNYGGSGAGALGQSIAVDSSGYVYGLLLPLSFSVCRA